MFSKNINIMYHHIKDMVHNGVVKLQYVSTYEQIVGSIVFPRSCNFLMSLGFTKSKVDSNLYYKVVDSGPMILLLYVDDWFLIGDKKLITESKRKIDIMFDMKDLGMMHYILGLEVWKRLDDIFLNQGKYVVDILKMFDMMDYKDIPMPMVTKLKLLSDSSLETMDVTLYRQMIKSLMYLKNTRLDTCFLVNTLGQSIVDLRHVHIVVEKHVLRYLKVTIDYTLRYVSYHETILHGYADSDWVGSVADRKSTSGYCFSLGSPMIPWFIRKKTDMALSTLTT